MKRALLAALGVCTVVLVAASVSMATHDYAGTAEDVAVIVKGDAGAGPAGTSRARATRLSGRRSIQAETTATRT